MHVLEMIIGEIMRRLDETANLVVASAKFDCAEWQFRVRLLGYDIVY